MARVKKHRLPATGAQEYVCQCPRCLTLETLWFKGDALVPTIKFSQGKDGRIYHACNGGLVACRLFPGWKAGFRAGEAMRGDAYASPGN